MAFVTSHARAIYTERYGNGPAVLFLHGAGSNAATWYQQIPTFAAHYTCITMDQRCFGRSLAPLDEFRFDLLVDDARAVLDHWGVASAAIVGQSLGGMVGLRLALQHPNRVSAFVACDSPLGIAHPDMERVLAARARDGNMQAIEQRALGTWFRQRSPEGAQLYAAINAFNPSTYVHGREAWAAAMTTLLAPAALLSLEAVSALRCPTLWLVGREDPLVPVSVMADVARRVGGSELVVVADTGHSTYFEKPEAFNDHVLSFLGRRLA